MSYEGLEPNILDARVDREGAAGKQTLDVLVGGSSELLQLVPKGLLAPIRPLLCLPEVTDRRKWTDDQLLFTDEQRMLLFRCVSSVYGGILINTKNVPLNAIKTSADVLKPEFKGKIISSPYQAGSGAGFASNVLYRLQLDYFTQTLQRARCDVRLDVAGCGRIRGARYQPPRFRHVPLRNRRVQEEVSR